MTTRRRNRDDVQGTGNVADAEKIVARVAREAKRAAPLAETFARAALRRVPAGRLADLDEHATAAWLVDAYEWFDQAPAEAVSVRLWTPDGASSDVGEGTVVEVVGEDRPFLLDTVTATIEAWGAHVRQRLHPIVGTRRDAEGRLVDLGAARDADRRESFLHVELDRRLDSDEAATLYGELASALEDVRRVTDDHQAMSEAVSEVADWLRACEPRPDDSDPPEEVAALLDWIVEGHLVLLGWRVHDIEGKDEEATIAVRPGSGLGILRDETRSRFSTPVRIDDLDPLVRDRVREAPLLRVTRTSRRSTVRRRRPMLDVIVTRCDADGSPRVVSRILGLMTATGTSVPTVRVPVLRDRFRRVLEAEDVVPGSHEERTLRGLFQSLPKDDLLEQRVESLRRTLVMLLEADEGEQARVLVRADPDSRLTTVVLGLPRDDYTPALRRDITRLLTERLGGDVDVDISMREQAEVVARFTVRSDSPRDVDLDALEQEILTLARPWSERVRNRLVDVHGPSRVSAFLDLVRRLGPAYRNRTAPDIAAMDVEHLRGLVTSGEPCAAWLVHRSDGLSLRLAQVGERVVLSDVMPALESVGLRVDAEHPHELSGDTPIHLHEYRFSGRDGQPPAHTTHLTDTILDALAGRLEVDGLNRLVTTADLSAHEVAIVRAYRRLRRQLGTTYTAEYANAAMADHPDAVRAALEVFRLRFDPDLPRDPEAVIVARTHALARCDEIERLDHDRIVRGFLDLVDATVRTTAWRDGWTTDDQGRRAPVLAFKFDPGRVTDVPRPIPHREIFVYSPVVEGVHLRAGPVARGGLRHSDRHDDMRTEVLGLVKAQVGKNALIVPTGAKGGFVCKRLPTDRDAARADVQRQYVAFISALLDLTDDLVGGEVVHPDRVVCEDGEDPYLVVAADKGTATFSDVANRVAEERGFWLGDAFASGGSSGYDHKALGITARGAWAVVARHFHEMGVDVQVDPVTTIGVGDMSGDVFGNGMLLSRTIRLVAAFDHRDLFIDPDPDPEATFLERQRLFDLPGSSWQDVDRSVLSDGAMVVSRAVKTVQPTPQVCELLGLPEGTVPPDDLVRAVLRCRADLLWFGGIGTYVRASSETDADVGDRVNDAVRVAATDVGARVVGEGANLAVTPRARIEYARRGGRIDQDAIHNAGGVDISDHEVNLKILLDLAEAEGRLDRTARNRLLAEVADDVVAHVLRDVDRQAAQLSQLAVTSANHLGDLRRLVEELEGRGVVDRVIDTLPDDDEFDQRAEVGAGLTRPELATLLGAAKRVVADAVGSSSLPDDPIVATHVEPYLPRRVAEVAGDLLPRHRLHRELVATVATNNLVDRMGPVWPFLLVQQTGAPLDRVLAATLAAWHVTDAERWWGLLDAAEDALAPTRVLALSADLQWLVGSVARRLLDDDALPDVAAMVARDGPAFAAMVTALPTLGDPARAAGRRLVADALVDDFVDPSLADVLAGVTDLALVTDVAAAARELDADPADVADRMLRLGVEHGLARLRDLVDASVPRDEWDRRQRDGLMADVQRLHARLLLASVARAGSLEDADDQARTSTRQARVEALLAELHGLDDPPLAALGVAVRAVTDLVVG